MGATTFDGGHGSPGEMEFKNGDVEYKADKDTMTEFFGGTDGKQIQMEKDGYFSFDACLTGRGKEGDEFLSHVADVSGRRAIGYTALVVDYALPMPFTDRALYYNQKAYGGKRTFGNYEQNTRKLGPSYKYQKHVDPGGDPVRYNNHKEPYLKYGEYPAK